MFKWTAIRVDFPPVTLTAPAIQAGSVTNRDGATRGPAHSKRGLLARIDRRVRWAAFLPALVTLAICTLQLSWHNVLFGVHEYDDGVYLGAALRLVSGVVPYRDFVIVHPPGIVVLMAPVALLGKLLGTNVALAAAREVTALVAAANVALAGLAVRHKGARATLVAAMALACFPMAPAADSTLFLEPYLIFFCLLAMTVMFSQGRLASPRRLAVAGLLLGFAFSVKVWAIAIVVAASLVCVRRLKTALLPLLAGCGVGAGAIYLPFLSLAPHQFVRDVFADQMQRVAPNSAAFPLGQRVLWMTGAGGLTSLKAAPSAAVAAGLVFAAAVAVVFVRLRRVLSAADAMVLMAAGGSVVTLLAPSELYPHYVYFTAPFLSLLLGATVAEALDGIGALRRLSSNRASVAVASACVLAGVFLIPQQLYYARAHLSDAKDPTGLTIAIPPGACIVSDESVVEISADLFMPAKRHCPALVDAFGTWLADGPSYEPQSGDSELVGGVYKLRFSAKFVREWGLWLNESDFVVQLAPEGGYVPWTTSLRQWFFQNFKPVRSPVADLWIYQHVGHASPPGV